MAIEEHQIDLAFAALADPTRRAILARLAAGEATVTELGRAFPFRQPTISRHLRVLEQAGLVEGERAAQRRPRRLKAEGMRAMADWMEPFRKLWEDRLDNLDRHLRALNKKEK